VGVPSALQCYTWPNGAVTQTFDPQSPPCIATWPEAAKGNGGATSQGVSGTEIRIAYPVNKSSSQLTDMQKVVDFYNTRFQLYGRKLVLVPFDSEQAAQTYTTNGTSSPTQQKADAETAAGRNVFAAVDYVDGGQGTLLLPEYIDTLAARHVISATGGLTASLAGTAHLAKHAPFEWSYYPQLDELMSNAAAVLCRQLAGHPATRSPDYRTTTRRFALLLPDQGATGVALPGLDRLSRGMGACGAAPVSTIYYPPTDNAAQQTFQASLIGLRRKGVTSLVFFPWNAVADTGGPQQQATRVGYRPEFFVLGWQQGAAGQLGYEATPTEKAALFGIGAWNKLRASNDEFWAQAYATSGDSIAGKAIRGGAAFYHELLLLASGIQMAGPHLTPPTFAAALHSTEFPNPGAGTRPYYQARVGFGDGQPIMVHDFNAWWIDPATNAATLANDSVTYNPYRNLCYVGLGQRWAGSSWPTQDRWFQGACR
jgi:hypothetical protein